MVECTCSNSCLIHDISDDLAFKMSYNPGEMPYVVHMPSRLGGRATIGHRRISTEMVADMYWESGFSDLTRGYDLTHGEVVVAVWYESLHGTRARRGRWKEWVETNEIALWSPSMYGTPTLPPTRTDHD